MRPRLLCALVLAAMLAALAGCGGSGGGAAPADGTGYHEPSQGWTADVPQGWHAVALGPTFVRGDPLRDPTRLLVEAYPGATPAAALRSATTALGIRTTAGEPPHEGRLTWRRMRGRAAGGALAARVAVAADGDGADVVALVARPGEIAALTGSALTPVLDSFAPGDPAAPASVLAQAPPDPSYWPTAGWRAATPASQGMDASRLDAMVAEIRSARLPIDSVMVVRHGRVVLDRSFGRFAAGTLPEPFAAGPLHELQSATKSVTSIVLGAALAGQDEVTVDTPITDLAAAAGGTVHNLDPRKGAVRVEDLLTMQSGLRWRETGYAYTPGSGNDVVAMVASPNWTQYVVDRPMAAAPGTTFAYDTGTSHLASGVVSILTGTTADAFARTALFRPLGITRVRWVSAPEGVSSGGFGLAMRPGDLAKLAFLSLHRGAWDGRRVVPASWMEASTTDHVAPPQEYGYLWWLDRADGYAYMAGLYGQLAVVDPADDLVAVVTAHVPAAFDGSTLTRWLVEEYVLPAAR